MARSSSTKSLTPADCIMDRKYHLSHLSFFLCVLGPRRRESKIRMRNYNNNKIGKGQKEET